MAVSIMLTSCGKSAGLSNSGKKADNKIPAASPTPKPQPQKIDNYNIKQSLTNYVKDNIFVIGSITLIAIVIGSVVWIIKNNNKPHKITDPKKQPEPSKLPETNGQPQIIKPPKMIDICCNLGRTDYETHYLSFPSGFLTNMINSNSSNAFQKHYAAAELERRKFVPFSIPYGVDTSTLVFLSTYTNEALERVFDSSSPARQQAINFIFKCREKIE